MTEPILFVDDDIHVIAAFQRSLCRSYQIEIAQGPADALEAINGGAEFAVVVSDLQMPGMNGIEFLAKVREAAPQAVRILLIGQADVDAAIAAVNDGHYLSLPEQALPPYADGRYPGGRSETISPGAERT